MNEELQKKLVEVITSAQGAGKEAFLFTKEQLPEVAEQILKYQLVTAVLWLALTLVIAVLLAYGIYRVLTDEHSEEGVGWCLTFFFMVNMVFIVGNLSTITKVVVAPKVYLLEYARELVGGK